MKRSNHSLSLLLVAGGLVVLLLSLLVGTPPAQAVDAPLPALTVMPARMPLYKITDLGSLAGAGDSYAYGINDLGHVVGKSAVGGTDVTHAFLWRDGIMIDLGSPTGNSTASAINNYGMVVGTADVESEHSVAYHAFLWSAGNMVDLGTLGGVRSAAYDITDNAWVVGWSDRMYYGSHAFGMGAGGHMREIDDTFLHDSGWEISRADAINEHGMIAGTIRTLVDGTHHYRAFMLQGTQLTDLWPTNSIHSMARDINDIGQVVGDYYYPDSVDERRAFLWQNGGITDLGTLGGETSYVYGINDAGWMVGFSDISRGDAITAHAFVGQGTYGGMSDLNDLIPSNSGWLLRYAYDINEDGQIVGVGKNGNWETHAFLLTPLPQPSILPTLELSIIPTREFHLTTPSP